jgi:hypothetical protein
MWKTVTQQVSMLTHLYNHQSSTYFIIIKFSSYQRQGSKDYLDLIFREDLNNQILYRHFPIQDRLNQTCKWSCSSWSLLGCDAVQYCGRIPTYEVHAASIFITLHGITTQKTLTWIFTTVKASNLANGLMILGIKDYG